MRKNNVNIKSTCFVCFTALCYYNIRKITTSFWKHRSAAFSCNPDECLCVNQSTDGTSIRGFRMIPHCRHVWRIFKVLWWQPRSNQIVIQTQCSSYYPSMNFGLVLDEWTSVGSIYNDLVPGNQFSKCRLADESNFPYVLFIETV